MLIKIKTSLLLLCLLFCGMVSPALAAGFTALWDFQNLNPSTLKDVRFEGTEGHVGSTRSGVNMFVIAKQGKYAQRASDVQINANTYLRIAVYNVGDKITITAHPGYHNYTIGDKTATGATFSYTATATDVQNGWAQFKALATCYLLSIRLDSGESDGSTAAVALWDFANVNPASLSGVYLEQTSGHVASTLDGIRLFVLAQWGKFAQRTSDAQFNQKTTVRVPVTAQGDKVTVTSATGYHNYAIGGIHSDQDVMTYTASAADAQQGYVVLYSYGATYLKSIRADLQKYVKPTSTSTGGSSSGSQGTYNDNTQATSVATTNIQNYVIVRAGDASSLLSAIDQANRANTSTSAARYYIYLPKGTYDLGTKVLTEISGHNISIIGQEMEQTIVRNAPSIAVEGISTTATLLIKGQNTYLQDLTLQNALDYYGNGSNGGRAVALQDKGNRTICKNVRLLSYQDTYYSNGRGQYYWEGGDIHGTVDFICGGGDVFFNGTQLTVEKRKSDGTGGCTITAPNVDESNKGYVFNNCTIVNYAQNYNFGRAWGGKPRAAFINTTLQDPSRLVASRWTTEGMNTYADRFVEYNSKDSNGKTVSPASHVLTFTKNGSKQYNTILSASEAAAYALSKVFADWQPNNLAAQVSVSGLSANGTTLSWQKDNASAFAIYKDEQLLTIVGASQTSYTVTSGSGTYRVRAANAMGGLGTAASVSVSSTSGSSGSSTSGALSQYDLNRPIGWATVGGSVTGSQDKNAVLVTTMSELQQAMSGTDQRTIYVQGTLTTSTQIAIQNAQNKTVYGLPGATLANTTHTADASKTGILTLKNCSNIIIRNLTFKGPGAYDIDGRDNLTVQNSQYIWVDHCDFQDGCDGNFDINNGSDNISVTWCRFRYRISPWAGGSGGSDDHRFSNLIGGSDKSTTDAGKLRITFANCWWDEGCKSRLPRVRFGQVHIVNCLYSSSVISYCVGAGYRSNVYVDNTAFTSSAARKTPWSCMATTSGYTDYNIQIRNCDGVSDVRASSGGQAFFDPYATYSYAPYAANLVNGVVSASAGATLSIAYGQAPSKKEAADVLDFESDFAEGMTTDLADLSVGAQEVVSRRIFDLAGRERTELQPGINIIRTTMADGQVSVERRMVR